MNELEPVDVVSMSEHLKRTNSHEVTARQKSQIGRKIPKIWWILKRFWKKSVQSLDTGNIALAPQIPENLNVANFVRIVSVM